MKCGGGGEKNYQRHRQSCRWHLRAKTAINFKRVNKNATNLRDGFFLIFYRFENYFFTPKCEKIVDCLCFIDNGIQGTGVFDLFGRLQ